jgi:hypothetical protein
MNHRILLLAAVALLATSCDQADSPAALDTTERLVMLAPAGGETFHLGDTIRVACEYRHSADSSHFVTFWFSPDNGATMDVTLFERSSLFQGQTLDTAWIIPMDSSFLSDSATIRVEDYSRRATMFGYCAGTFRIAR